MRQWIRTGRRRLCRSCR